MTQTDAKDGFRIKDLGRHSFVYGVGLALSKAVSFVMLPIYTRWLTPSDYGVLQLITMTFEVVTILAGSRIAIGIFHFYHKASDEVGRKLALSTSHLLLGATYGAAAALTIVLAPSISDFVFGQEGQYALHIRIAAAAMAFEGLTLVPLALIQLENRSGLFVGLSLVKLGLQLVFNLIFLIAMDMGVIGVLMSSLIANVVMGIGLALRIVSCAGTRFESTVAKGFLRFGLPLVAMQGATFILTFGDRYFLTRAADTTEVGLYGLAYQFGFLVATVGYAPFQRVWDPQRFAVAKRPDRDEVFASVFVYLNLLLVSAALGIALFGGDVLRIIAAEPFHSAAAYIPLLAAAYVFQCWGNFLNLGIYVKERTEFFTLANWVAALVALVGYVVLIPRWLSWGAVVATAASLLVRCMLAYAFSQRLWRIEYRWRPVFYLISLALGIGLVSEIVPAMALIPSVAFHAALLGGYLALGWVAPILTSEERDAVRSRVLRRAPVSRSLVS